MRMSKLKPQSDEFTELLADLAQAEQPVDPKFAAQLQIKLLDVKTSKLTRPWRYALASVAVALGALAIGAYQLTTNVPVTLQQIMAANPELFAESYRGNNFFSMEAQIHTGSQFECIYHAPLPLVYYVPEGIFTGNQDYSYSSRQYGNGPTIMVKNQLFQDGEFIGGEFHWDGRWLMLLSLENGVYNAQKSYAEALVEYEQLADFTSEEFHGPLFMEGVPTLDYQVTRIDAKLRIGYQMAGNCGGGERTLIYTYTINPDTLAIEAFELYVDNLSEEQLVTRIAFDIDYSWQSFSQVKSELTPISPELFTLQQDGGEQSRVQFDQEIKDMFARMEAELLKNTHTVLIPEVEGMGSGWINFTIQEVLERQFTPEQIAEFKARGDLPIWSYGSRFNPNYFTYYMFSATEAVPPIRLEGQYQVTDRVVKVDGEEISAKVYEYRLPTNSATFDQIVEGTVPQPDCSQNTFTCAIMYELYFDYKGVYYHLSTGGYQEAMTVNFDTKREWTAEEAHAFSNGQPWGRFTGF
jgi:hypothetical protein